MRSDSYHIWLAIAAGLLFLTLVLVWQFAASQPDSVPLVPVLTGELEYCLTCHAELDEISPSHSVETFGCVRCHGGERLALDADLAHSTMRGGANPSNLAVAEESCGGGDCHSGSETDGRDHVQRVMTSIQATYAGAIANIRYTFGAQPDLTPVFATNAVTDPHSQTGIALLDEFDLLGESHPSIVKFGENCLNCHLNAKPTPELGEEYIRFAGCAACHSPLTPKPSGEDWDDEKIHTLTTAISYSQCNTCHNRGNYDLRTIEFVERSDHPMDRFQDYYQPIAQFTQCEYTLDCIDCHTRTEAMGDGDIHANQKDIVYVQCKTCHGTLTELPQTKTLTNPDDIAFTLAFLNPIVDLELGDILIITEKGEPLWNTRELPDGSYELVGKASGHNFTFRPVMGSSCQQNPLEQESRYCHKCHAVER